MPDGFLEILVSVTSNRSSNGLNEGFGSGATDKVRLMNQPFFETNIGTVLTVKDAIRSDGEQYIECKEGGNPKGPFAPCMEGSISVLFHGGSVLSSAEHGFYFPHKSA